MSELLKDLPSASSVCNLKSVKIDKDASANGAWCIFLEDGETYAEMRVAYSAENKAYSKATREHMSKLNKKKSGDLDVYTDIDPDKFQKLQAEWLSKWIVREWRTFIPTRDEHGSIVYTIDADGDSVAEGKYYPVVSDGERWLEFSIANCEALLKANPPILQKISSFAGSVDNYYEKNLEDTKSIGSIAA